MAKLADFITNAKEEERFSDAEVLVLMKRC
jgi:hypothetical protein